MQHPRYGSWLPSPGTASGATTGSGTTQSPGSARIAFLVLEGLSATAGASREAVVGALVRRANTATTWVVLGQAEAWADSAEALAVWTAQLGQRYATDASSNRLAIHKLPGHAPQARWNVQRAGHACADAASCAPQGTEVWGLQAHAELARALGDGLLSPLRRHLQATDRWVISADPRFALVPWDVLWWNGKPLAASVSVVLESRGGRGFDESVRRERPSRTLWAIGNPAFEAADKETRGAASRALRSALRTESIPAARLDEHGRLALEAKAWVPLPGTAQELSWAATHFRRAGGSATVAAGALASESRIRDASARGELKQADVLLFATHAFFNERDPRQSAVVLHREGQQADRDGYLTPTEIVGLNLNAVLSVVSGCSTSRGASATGDAAAGFAYALRLAGSRSNLLTLWPVSDRAAAAFVSSLMARVARGQAPAAALQATKREFMQHANPEFRSPRHWAAFVLHGS